jgi:hypothetical protein
MQAKIGIVKLVKNFRMLPSSRTLIPMKYNPPSGFMSPLGGLFLKYEEL